MNVSPNSGRSWSGPESGQALLVDREQVVLAALVGAVERVCTPDERRRLGELTDLLDRLAAVM
jgi:hypothetical protein